MIYSTLGKICVTLAFVVIFYMFLQGGTNLGWTAFIVLLVLFSFFKTLYEKECEIEILRYEMWNFAFGGAKGKEEAQSYANEQRMLLEITARRVLEKIKNK